jgi:hypothetical protein
VSGIGEERTATLLAIGAVEKAEVSMAIPLG